MAKPLIHAKNSVKRYGGVIDDYVDIHNFMDSTKAALPDVRHRAILHSSFGIFLAEKLFGTYFNNSEGKQVSTRDIAEDHVREDLGFIPTIERWFEGMKVEDWMSGPVVKSKTFIPMEVFYSEANTDRYRTNENINSEELSQMVVPDEMWDKKLVD